MSIDFLYQKAYGRALLKVIQTTGLFHAGAWFLKSPLSKKIIPGYIQNNHIDMSPFSGQQYKSFAEFFGRKKETIEYDSDKEVLISPCDGLLSIFPINDNMLIPMKGSHYTLSDIIPDDSISCQYKNGLCLVFRLQASDYHHFCAFDDFELIETHFIQGQLHSVQPIALENVPVYKLNRRWWSIINSAHFSQVIQLEVGAMMVGGVRFSKDTGNFSKGEELGNFELCGSTIALIINSEIASRLDIHEKFLLAFNGEAEVKVSIGEGIGKYK